MRGRCRRAARQPGNRGAYLLLLSLSDSTTIAVGGLGRLQFRCGNYIYVGSAMGGLEARVARHLRPKKRLHWHIDRLLARASIVGAVMFPSRKRQECSLAKTIHKSPKTAALARFGSTDCGCPSHLFYIGKRPFGGMLRMLDRTQIGGPGPSSRGWAD